MYELIEHRRLETAAASITFSNIPQIYTDIVLVTSIRGNKYAGLLINGSSSNTSMRTLWGRGDSAVSAFYNSLPLSNIFSTVSKDTSTASTFSNVSFYITNYAGSTAKSITIDSVGENNGTAAEQILGAGLWNSTAAITSLTLTSADDNVSAAGNFAQRSSATLYGINRTSVIGKPKAIGGNITYANGYWVHTFTGSGTFSAQQALEIDALVVAGGGAGGSAERGGGGGAGGLLTVSSRAISAGPYPVVIGAGGAGRASSVTGTAGNDGSSSSFLTTSTIGGGGGGGGYSSSTGNGTAGRSGGSGGGGGIQATSGQYSLPGGSGTAGQGNNGGSSGHDHATYGKGGGGGGAGGVGASITANGQTGTGGIGMLWNGTYYAGGGGGAGDGTNGTGPGGLGGGGRAGFSGTPAGADGTANTGGGGGAGWFNPNASSGAGGSGVVVIRYRAD
jgi:hypothetical protein